MKNLFNTYHSTIQFVLDCYKTQEMCDKDANKCFLAFTFFPSWYETQEITEKLFLNDTFMLVYCQDKYKTQKMCDEAVHDCLVA